MRTTAEPICSDAAPRAIGPYSQAIRVGDLVFLSGQLGLDPQTGQLVSDDVGLQTDQVMRNLGAVLEAAGGGLRQLVKTTIFLTNLADFATVNARYGSFFEGAPPARATVEVSALPKDGRVEIEGVAYLG